ncbi:hypothetical protein [Shinella zoogloeoides]|uniref:hypothetical protein n=1 Tax=Shinella zoogloeoides TaxID=352475 RepID=UPI00299D5945|nr:hypothetical protein [Shinella zoogloeoides]
MPASITVLAAMTAGQHSRFYIGKIRCNFMQPVRQEIGMADEERVSARSVMDDTDRRADQWGFKASWFSDNSRDRDEMVWQFTNYPSAGRSSSFWVVPICTSRKAIRS